MSLSILNWNELPDGIIQTLVIALAPAATGKTNVIRGGQHGKLQLLSGQVVTRVHDTTAPVIAVEDGAGNDAATGTASTTAQAAVALTLSSYTVIDPDEDIDINVTTAGGATARIEVFLTFKNTR